jgi:hypothetical protein
MPCLQQSRIIASASAVKETSVRRHAEKKREKLGSRPTMIFSGIITMSHVIAMLSASLPWASHRWTFRLFQGPNNNGENMSEPGKRTCRRPYPVARPNSGAASVWRYFRSFESVFIMVGLLSCGLKAGFGRTGHRTSSIFAPVLF